MKKYSYPYCCVITKVVTNIRNAGSAFPLTCFCFGFVSSVRSERCSGSFPRASAVPFSLRPGPHTSEFLPSAQILYISEGKLLDQKILRQEAYSGGAAIVQGAGCSCRFVSKICAGSDSSLAHDSSAGLWGQKGKTDH